MGSFHDNLFLVENVHLSNNLDLGFSSLLVGLDSLDLLQYNATTAAAVSTFFSNPVLETLVSN
jgi:hypothetical protein